MVNTKELNKAIRESGLKREYIAEQLGLSATSLSYKVSGKREFKNSELGKLFTLLGLNDFERIMAIFFAD